MCGQPTLLHLLVFIFYALHWDIISQTSLKITKVSYSLIKLVLQFYSWDFDILNYETLINEFQTVKEFQYSVASSLIDSGVGLVLSIWFILAVVLNSENNFIIAKLTVWVSCGVASYNDGQIVCMFTDATAEITA